MLQPCHISSGWHLCETCRACPLMRLTPTRTCLAAYVEFLQPALLCSLELSVPTSRPSKQQALLFILVCLAVNCCPGAAGYSHLGAENGAWGALGHGASECPGISTSV